MIEYTATERKIYVKPIISSLSGILTRLPDMDGLMMREWPYTAVHCLKSKCVNHNVS